jgi:pimeloyl-ACP methyl ester carboxylesterase
VETTSLPEDGVIGIGALRLHYLDWGSTNAAPMVLLHNLCADAHCWDFLESIELIQLQERHST